MLTFKRGGYSLEELIMMESALNECVENTPCTRDCNSCKWRKLCGDFSRCLAYVRKLISQKNFPNP